MFNSLSKNSVLVANYPFATIDPNIGIVNVPDNRLIRLAEIYKSDRIVPATVKFIDIAGLVAGASRGEGLGNQFLAHIRSTAVIVEVVRAFKNDQVTHVSNQINPKEDISVINTELVLADLMTLKRRLDQLSKEAKADPKLNPQLELLTQAYGLLNDNRPLYPNLDTASLEKLHDLQPLSAKPIIFLFNIGEDEITDSSKQNALAEIVAPAPAIFVSAKLESELVSLSDSDAAELRESYAIKRSGLIDLISLAYKTLGLQSFLTAGEKEVRAWTIPVGSSAPKAAGTIHSDFERGFIAAEIVSYGDLDTLGSFAAAKAAGKVRTEGKDYIVQPNDVIEFRFNN